jgi:FAD/FMN-containing dehydrogenase
MHQVNDKTKDFLAGVNKVITDALPNHDQGAYAGYVDPALGENSASLYWGGNVERLQRIKAEVDPLDVFSNPQSVRPAKKSVKERALVSR